MHESLKVNRLRTLKVWEQSDQPEKKEHRSHTEPDPHYDLRLHVAQAQRRAEQAADERRSAEHHRAHGNNHGHHRAESAGALPLIAREPPAQPENGLELFPVQSSLQPAQLLPLL